MFERLDSRKKKKKIVENAARFYGFKKELNETLLKGNELFLVAKELYNVLNDLPGGLAEKVVSAGIKVGEVGRKFRFSLEGTFFLAKKEKKRVYVDKKAEMLFLYGRDVFSSSIKRVSEDIKENDVVFVCNLHGDVLGLGRARFNAEELMGKGDRVAVENLLDRGEYLRKEKLYEAF